MFRIVAFIGEAAERFSGLLKLLYPHGEFDNEAVRECLGYVLEVRRRVKELLKKTAAWSFTMCN